MLVRNPTLFESYFVSSFTGGLKEDIRFVKMFKLNYLTFYIEQARIKEKDIEACLTKNKNTVNPIEWRCEVN